MAMMRLKQTAAERSRNSRPVGGAAAAAALQKHFPADTLLWAGSGTMALYYLFKACKKVNPDVEVGLASYTCPQIAAAALRAGVSVRVMDVKPNTFEITAEELADPPSVVVLSNLYGLPDALDADLCSRSLVIDDACQAMLSRRGESAVGCAADTIGVLSFGRGKSLSGIGCGALSAAKHKADDESFLARALAAAGKKLSADSAFLQAEKSSKLAFEACAYWLLGSPWLYGIPSSLPFLGLGETVVDLDFKLRRAAKLQLAAAAAQVQQWGYHCELRCRNAAIWNEVLIEFDMIHPLKKRNLDVDDGTVPLRYPVICRDAAQRSAAHAALSKAGLGVSASYPRALTDYPEFDSPLLKAKDVRGGRTVAERILTFPVHDGVTGNDFERAVKLLRQAL